MQSRSFKNILYSTFFGISVILLAVSLLGQLSSLGDYTSHPPFEWEKYDSALVQATGNYISLLNKARTRLKKLDRNDPETIMNVLYDIVASRFSHGEARHSIFSNWILYFLSIIIHKDFGHIFDPNTIVAREHSALCDQSSYLLLKMAAEMGLRVRHVGLNGHVVMEAWYDDDWHLYDPD